jgi:GT2 family glycosyltransferase
MIKCTVAIPFYNRKNDVLNPVAIDSAIKQSLPEMEILLIDDCSTDGTWELLQKFRDPRVRLVRNERRLGLFGNFSRCLELARGEYVRLLCSDDSLMPDCLKQEIAIIDQYPQASLVLTRGRRVDEKGAFLGLLGDHFQPGIYSGTSAIRSALWFQAYYAFNAFSCPSGVLLRRKVALLVGQFDKAMCMYGDVDFYLRMLEHGDLIVCDTTGFQMTIHDNQETACLTGNVAIMQELLAITERYRLFFKEEGMYSSVLQQLSAYILGLAFKFWRMGLLENAKAHWKLVKQMGIAWQKTIFGVLRLLCLRFWMRISGKRLMPDRPYIALVSMKD